MTRSSNQLSDRAAKAAVAPDARQAKLLIERLEGRYLLTWIGATSGVTNDLGHQYDNVGNWAGGVIDDSFAGVTFTANTSLYLAANRTTVAAGINLGYGGNFDLTLKSSNATLKTLTLAGDIAGSFGGSNVVFGDVANPLNIAIGAATRNVTVGNGQNVTFLNVISGTSVGLTKAGTGTLTLSGVNTYTGTTTLNVGQLNINNAKGTGNGPLVINGGSLDNTSGGAITLSNTIAQTWGGDFAFIGTAALNLGPGAVSLTGNRSVTTNASTLTEAGVISGAFGLTKAGAGALTLGGVNTFSGGLKLSAGQLNLNSTKAPGSGTLEIDGGSIDNTSGGALTLANNNAQTWNANFIFVGSYALNLGTGAVAMAGQRAVTVSASALTVSGVLGDGGNAYSLTKNGAGALTLAGANTFSGGVTLSAGQLNINNASALGTGTLEIDGGTIDNTSAAAITLATNNAQLWGGDFTFVGTKALNLGTGNVTLGGNRNVSVATAAIALTVGGIISDAASHFSISKSGAGILNFTGSNTFSGGTNLNAGTLSFANGSLGSGAITFVASSTLQWAGSNTQDVSASIAAIANGVVATIDTVANNVAFANAISGQGGIAKIGTGTLTLSVGNTLTGGVTLTAGTLNLNDAGALGTGLFTINGGTINNTSVAAIVLSTNNAMSWAGNFTFTGTRNLDLGTGSVTITAARTVSAGGVLTIGGVIGGAFALTKAGTGAMTLTNANTYTGGTTLSAGALNVNHASAIPAGTLTINGTGTLNNTSGAAITLANNNAVALNGNLTFGGTNTLNLGTGTITLSAARSITVTAGTTTIAGVITGGFSLSKAGSGALTLTNANTHTGGTTLTLGTLNINNAAALGTGTFTITAGTIDNTSGAPITLSTNNAQVWGNFTVGNTNVLNLGTGAVSIGANRTVTVNAGTFTVPSVISGAFSLTKAGVGALTLTGANTYSGGTIVSAGTLNLTSASSIGTGTLTMSGGTLDNASGNPLTLANSESWGGNFTFAGTNDLTFIGNLVLTSSKTITTTAGTLAIGGNVTGAFSLTKAGAGALAFSGTNTYSGGTILTTGELDINSPSALGTGTLTINGGTINNTSGAPVTMSTNNAQTWGSNVNFAGSNNLAFGTGTITLSASRTITTAAGSLTLNGVITGAFALTKAGSGTIITTGNSTFSAGLTINNGTWYANNSAGSGTGTGLTTVNAGGTLAGTGAVKAVTVNSGGALSPGMNTTAVFSTGNLILAAGSNLNITLNGDVSGTDYDALNVVGTVTVTGDVLNLSGTRSAHTSASLQLITNDAGDAIAGTFAGKAQGSITNYNGVDYAANYVGGSGNDFVFSANLAATTSTISADTNSTIYGQPITFTAVVTEAASGTPTGAVTFEDGGTPLGSSILDAAGHATFTTTLLDAGTHSITVVYGSDANFASSESSTITQTVLQASSATAISSSISPSVVGQTVTLTAAVTPVAPGAGLATGTITFKDGATVLGTSTLDGSGIATLDTSLIAVGTRSVTAEYAGDSNFIASASTPITQTVNQAATGLTLASSQTPTTFGEALVLTATVAVGAPGNGMPTGIITFKEGATVVGVRALDGAGVATFDASTLGAGSHLITAVYGGDASYLGSTSSAIAQQIDQAATSTSVVSSIGTTDFGQATTLTASVAVTASGAGTASGIVQFYDGVTLLGSASLDGLGNAALLVSILAAGSHSLTATYVGNADCATSTSSAVVQNVNPSATTTALTSSAATSSFGQSVVLTAVVVATAPGGGVPTGAVTFRDGATVLGTVTLDGSGVAAFTSSTFTVGAHALSAAYDGSTNHTTSATSTFTQTVIRSATSSAVSSSAAPSVFGQNVTFTAAITATSPGSGVPTGTVTFMDGTAVLGNGTLNGAGVATFSTASLTVASHSIQAIYESDAHFAGSTSSTLTQAVNQSATSTSLGALSVAVHGQAITFTATVAATLPGAGTPGGTVMFMDGATPLGSGTLNGSGVATYTTSSLSVASHTITVIYSGDTQFAASTSTAATQVVHQAATSVTIGASVNPSKFGQAITLTATVATTSPGTGVALGTVTFKDGAAVLGTGTLDGSGVATFTTSAIGFGSHSITAVYAGATDYATSTSAALTQTVDHASTTTTLASSVAPSTFGQSTTFTAHVAVNAPGTGSPSGAITFKNGATTLGVVELDASGDASISLATLGVGTHSITASYAGDSQFVASISAAFTQTVNIAATTSTLSSSVTPAAFGQVVTFTAAVIVDAPGEGVPGGTVTFKNGSSVLGTVPLDGGGTAIFTTPSLAVGTHSITVVYNGISSFAASTSSALSQVITQASTSTFVSSSASPSASGQTTTFTATVAAMAPGAGAPSGDVTFKNGATVLGVATLNGSGVATFATNVLGAGSHSITVDYAGDTNFAASTSPVLTQSVGQASTAAIIASSTSPSVFGQTITLTATVAAVAPGTGTPSGTVTFKDGSTILGSSTLDGSGIALLDTHALVVGSHPITVNYSGDTNFVGTTSSASTQIVDQASTSIAVSSSVHPAVSGQSFTLTAVLSIVSPGTGSPTGTVTFRDGLTTLGTGTVDGSGVATFTTSALPVGNHSISATYTGDSRFNASTSSTIPQTVDQATTAASITSSARPSAFGQPVALTAHIDVNAPGSGSPSGVVTFTDGVITLGTANLDGSGDASITIATLAVGTHAIVAIYAGDAHFVASTSSSLTQVVDVAATATLLSTSVSPSAFGETVTFTATVTATAPGTGVPSGAVTFKEGSTILGIQLLDGSGSAAFEISSLSLGSHFITAVYAGASGFSSSSSVVLTQHIVSSATTAHVTSSIGSTVFGQSTVLTATISAAAPGTGVPTGSVQFKDGSTLLGTAVLDGAGVAAFETDLLSVGSHLITVVYDGDANYAAKTSAAVAQVVHPASTSISLAALSDTVFGQAITFAATVTTDTPGHGTAAGTVTFRDGSTVLGTATLDGTGVAVFTTSGLGVGTHSIVAVYSGDVSFEAGGSPTSLQSVSQANTATTVSASIASSVVGQIVTFTAHVDVATPGAGEVRGTITFRDGSSIIGTANVDAYGNASVAVASLSVGDHAITATYAGNTDFVASVSSPLTQTVGHAETTTSIISSTSPSAFGEIVTFTASVAATTPGSGVPAGLVEFRDGSTVIATVSLDSNGRASFATGLLGVGAHAITAIYVCDSDAYGSSSSTASQIVHRANTTATIVSTLASSVFGQSIELTASVAALAPGAGVPTGSMTFNDGLIILGVVALDGAGTARLNVSTLSVGGHAITATFSGDDRFTASDATTLTHSVGRAMSNTHITISHASAKLGQKVTLSVTVTATSAGSALAAGIVAFYDDFTLLGTATLDAFGNATFATAALGVGVHPITVVYRGDEHLDAGTSIIVPVTVTAPLPPTDPTDPIEPTKPTVPVDPATPIPAVLPSELPSVAPTFVERPSVPASDDLTSLRNMPIELTRSLAPTGTPTFGLIRRLSRAMLVHLSATPKGIENKSESVEPADAHLAAKIVSDDKTKPTTQPTSSSAPAPAAPAPRKQSGATPAESPPPETPRPEISEPGGMPIWLPSHGEIANPAKKKTTFPLIFTTIAFLIAQASASFFATRASRETVAATTRPTARRCRTKLRSESDAGAMTS